MPSRHSGIVYLELASWVTADGHRLARHHRGVLDRIATRDDVDDEDLSVVIASAPVGAPCVPQRLGHLVDECRRGVVYGVDFCDGNA